LRNAVVTGAALLSLAVAMVSAQDPPKRKSADRDPAYTAAQAERGKQVYEANCVNCHLPGLDGSANPTGNARGAPLVGARFVQDFGEGKVSALFNKMKRDMPNNRPGSLTDQEYLDLTSFVLQRNKFPTGATELTVDGATEVWIPGAGGAEGVPDYTYVSAVGCLSQDPSRSWLLTGAQEVKKATPPSPSPVAESQPTTSTDGPGAFTFRLLDAYHHNPEPHAGHKVRVGGHLVRLGAEIRVNVQTLEMIGPSCAN
jgi:mono/diheme cytochrome c family protein